MMEIDYLPAGRQVDHSTLNPLLIIKQEIMTNIAVFASGQGSNAQQIIRFFKDHPSIKVSLIVCNKPGAGVIEIGNKNKVEVLLINRQSFYEKDFLQELIKR